MKALVAAFNQEKGLEGAFSVITNLRMELFEALVLTPYRSLQHPQLMSGEEADERKANALKQSLDYLDLFLAASPYVATSHLTIADFSILASVTQLEGMEYKITAYP